MEKKTKKRTTKKSPAVKKEGTRRKTVKPISELENIVAEEPPQPLPPVAAGSDLLANVARAAGRTVGRVARLAKKIKIKN